jgi:DNA-binding response OmpR family regulator
VISTDQETLRPRLLTIEVEPQIPRCLTEELDGFHFILVAPSEAITNLRNRQLDLVLLDAAIAGRQRSEILAEASAVQAPVVILGTPSVELGDRHPVAPMPASPGDLIALLQTHIPQ